MSALSNAQLLTLDVILNLVDCGDAAAAVFDAEYDGGDAITAAWPLTVDSGDANNNH